MEGMGNLADVMLVLAVGFLLALIMSWNMDLMNQGPSVTEIGAMNQTEANPLDPGQGYEPMGRVYRDPVSGRLYLVTDEQTSE
jgi:hypothetical protein